MKANTDIRNRMDSLRIRQWEVAEQIGISAGRLSVWLRTPLNDERKARVNKAVDEVTKQTTVK